MEHYCENTDIANLEHKKSNIKIHPLLPILHPNKMSMYEKNHSRPTVSIVMISFNDEAIINDCLFSIRKQNYPQDNIEIIMVDGGSSDKTLIIAEKYEAKVISRPDLKDFPNIRGGIALTCTNSDYVLFFSADNRFIEKDTLSFLVDASLDEQIVGCETLRYGYERSDPPLSRYFALIGGADPIAVGLGKADRGPYDTTGWHGFGEVEDKEFFYKVSFPRDISKIPTLGANGFLIKNEFIKTTLMAQKALHIDMCSELILAGHNKFAFIKEKHVSHYLNLELLSFLKRRLFYAEMYDDSKVERLYKIYTPKDLFKLMYLVISNITFIIPTIRSLKGYLFHKDTAWFLHPVVSFVFTVGYSLLVLRRLIHKA